tara:strand:- start:1511 stop:2038 length:528 start_codon:yes stop_codon:yes gene_type:complete
MKQYKRVTGIVISKKDLFNGDRSISVLTETGFILNLYAKGIAKSLNREIISFDICSVSEFLYSNSIVTKSSLIKTFKFKNIKEYRQAFYMLKIINSIKYYDFHSKSIFLSLQNSLLSIGKNEEKSIISQFIISILESHGIMMDNLKKATIRELERHMFDHLDVYVNYETFMNYLS